MKFSCGECQAKYQIPDERVAGRKLKIRCRKCGAAISLRGDPTVEGIAGLPLAAPTVEWHVSLEGEQHGPYTSEQMATMLRGSQLDWEAYVWREGYGDWKTADASDTLVRAVASLGAVSGELPAATANDVTPAVRGGAVYTPPSGIAPYEDDDMPTRMKLAPEDDEQPTRMAVNAPPLAVHGQGFEPVADGQHAPQGTPLQPQARSAFAARATAARAYGSAPPSGQYATIPPAVSTPPPLGGANVRQLPVARSPRVTMAQAMTAERNEDSVLFSANNLVPQSTQQPAQRPGYAAAEGSGLIDIRALAALAHSHRNTVTQQPAATPSAAYPARAAAEEPLPAIVHQAGTFSSIDSLRPFERPAARTSNAVPIAIVAGFGMIAAALFLAVYLTQQPAASAPVVAASTGTAEQPSDDVLPTTAEAPTAVPAAENTELAAAVAPAQPEAAAPAAEPEPEAEPAREPSRKGGKVRASVARGARAAKAPEAPKAEKTVRAGAVAAKAVEEPEAPVAEKTEKEKPSIDDLLLEDGKDKPAAAAEPAKPKAPSGSRDLDSLMNGAVPAKGGAAAPAAAPAGDSSLPETPSRDDVQSAMKAVSADVKACAEGQTLADPTATVALTVIGATGRVQSVRVTGNQGAVGTCIARAVRAASFPKFSKVQMTINYPFKLK